MSQSFFLVNVFISVQSCLCNAHIPKHNVHFRLLSLTESRLFHHLLNSRFHPRRSPFISHSCSPAIPLVQPRDWPIPPIQPANSANPACSASAFGQSRLFSLSSHLIPPVQPPDLANSPCPTPPAQLPLPSFACSRPRPTSRPVSPERPVRQRPIGSAPLSAA